LKKTFIKTGWGVKQIKALVFLVHKATHKGARKWFKQGRQKGTCWDRKLPPITMEKDIKSPGGICLQKKNNKLNEQRQKLGQKRGA